MLRNRWTDIREREIEIESGKGEKYTKREEKKKKWQTKTIN